jgi:hypothetical protein
VSSRNHSSQLSHRKQHNSLFSPVFFPSKILLSQNGEIWSRVIQKPVQLSPEATNDGNEK